MTMMTSTLYRLISLLWLFTMCHWLAISLFFLRYLPSFQGCKFTKITSFPHPVSLRVFRISAWSSAHLIPMVVMPTSLSVPSFNLSRPCPGTKIKQICVSLDSNHGPWAMKASLHLCSTGSWKREDSCGRIPKLSELMITTTTKFTNRQSGHLSTGPAPFRGLVTTVY